MDKHIAWRLAALIGLGLYVLLLFLVVLFMIKNPLFVLLLAITIALAVYGCWLLFSGTDVRRHRGYVVFGTGALSLLLEGLYLIRQISLFRVAAGVLLLATGYSMLIFVLRKAYWAYMRRRGMVGGAHFKHPYLIVNPKAGNGRAINAQIDTLAAEQGVTVLLLTEADDVAALAARAIQEGADVLGISGGNGSIGAVAKTAIEHDVPVVVLPGGTRCHFARDLGLEPEKIVDALMGFQGVERKIDVGSINGRIFLNNASMGLYAEAVEQPGYRNSKRQTFQAIIQRHASGTEKPYDMKFGHGNLQFKSAVQVMVAVNPYKTFSMFELGQRQRMDGGTLQVSVVTKLNDKFIKQLLRGFTTDYLRQQKDLPGFYQWEDKGFSISNAKGALIVGVDGENETYPTPVDIQILPGALRIFVPPEGKKTRPALAMSPKMLKYLWDTVRTGKPKPT
jgi:diacylglycerol kinase family enzyme